MATVQDVRLEIGPEEERNRRRVTVSYRVCFSSCELLAGSVFTEVVTLRGDDPIWDDHLITLRRTCVKAQERCVDRRISVLVSESTLDEDPDTIILGWVIGNKDEVYARVCVTPFVPTGNCATSNIVSADFGPAGD